MSSSECSVFEEAVDAAQRYIRASVRARDLSYHFLASAYLAYREGQRRPQDFRRFVEARLKRPPTGPERKRPFLLILHVLLDLEDGLQPNALPHLSKLTTSLEEVHRAYKGRRPKTNDLVEYIRKSGGICGLYDLARIGTTNDSEQSTPTATPAIPLKPSEILLPAIGGIVTKVGRGYRLRLSDREPGVVRLRVGRGGFVECILDDADADFVAA